MSAIVRFCRIYGCFTAAAIGRYGCGYWALRLRMDALRAGRMHLRAVAFVPMQLRAASSGAREERRETVCVNRRCEGRSTEYRSLLQFLLFSRPPSLVSHVSVRGNNRKVASTDSASFGRVSFKSELILKIQKPMNRAKNGLHFIRRMFSSVCKVRGKNRFERDVNNDFRRITLTG